MREALARARRGSGQDADRRVLALMDKYTLSLAVLGRFSEILELLLPERERADRVRDPLLASAYFFRLGLTYSYLGEPGEAAAWAGRALEEAERGGGDTVMGDPVAAREPADRAVALMRDGGYPYGLGWTRRVLGHIARAAGDLETALAERADALAIFTSIHARFEAARTQLELAELAQARGDVAGATTWLTEAAQAFASMTVSRYDERIAALRAALPSA